MNKSIAEKWASRHLESPSVEFVSDDGHYVVTARVGIAAQNGTTPALILTGIDDRNGEVKTVALRAEKALGLMAFIQENFEARDDLTLAG